MAITRDQFQLQVDRLADTFGEKHFPDQRVLMIWEAVDGLEYPQVIAIVDSFIRESKSPPLPKDFSEAASSAKRSVRRYALGELQPREIAKCQTCLDSGFLRLIRREEYEPWAKWASGSAPCFCERGKQAVAAAKRMKSPVDLGPQFNDLWLTSYDILPYDASEYLIWRDKERANRGEQP